MKSFTRLRCYLLRLQLQILGVFHWAPIHWRLTCLLCSDKMLLGRAGDDDKANKRQKGSDNINTNESNSGGPQGEEEEFDDDLDESAGLFSAHNNNEEDIWYEEDEQLAGGICVTCESLRWNGEGHVVRNNEEWVPGPFHRAVGTGSSTIFMVILIVGMCYTIVIYFRFLFGRDDEVMHLTSFMSFTIGLGSVALICVYAKIRCYLGRRGRYQDTDLRPRHWGWCGVLHQDYVTRRLQYLSGANGLCLPSIPFHTLCLLWPVLNMIIEIVYYSSLSSMSHINSIFTVIQISSVTAGMVLFGVFCYTIFLLRCSFESECNLLLAFFQENEGYLDRCRMRLADTYRDYRLFRSAIRAWIAFIVAIGILGLTVHLSWNYDVYSGNEEAHMKGEDLILLNILIFSEKIMITCLPVIAVGGMDLGYLWRHFQLTLSRNRRSEYEYFWERLAYYLHDLNENDRATGITMFLSVVSLYTGLRVGAQNLDYARIPGN